jgi:hypothetical protein
VFLFAMTSDQSADLVMVMHFVFFEVGTVFSSCHDIKWVFVLLKVLACLSRLFITEHQKLACMEWKSRGSNWVNKPELLCSLFICLLVITQKQSLFSSLEVNNRKSVNGNICSDHHEDEQFHCVFQYCYCKKNLGHKYQGHHRYLV